jgi:trehalose 6-phosphate phosphatase
VGVKVAVDSAEAPPELLARADLIVAGPAGLVELLRKL